MVAVPFPPFAPDGDKYNAGALPLTINVIPKVDGWGPLQAVTTVVPELDRLTDFSGLNILTDSFGNRLLTGTSGSADGRLPDACTGFFAARKDDGSEILFAGTAEALYAFNTTLFTWEDVTGPSGPYAAACRWSFVKFGSVVYCQNGFDPEQKFNIETDTLFSDNTTAPICKYLAVVGDFVFRGNVISWASQSIGAAPTLVQCSALNNPEDNEPQNSNFSDYQYMPTGDEVMGIVALSGGCHIWMRSALHGLALALESGYTFTRSPIDEMRGTSAPYSIGILGQNDYVIYNDDGYWRSQSGGFTPIGQSRVNQWFLTESDQDERENILAMPDPERNIVWIAYTATDGTRKMLGYHHVLDRWCLSDISLSASARARTFLYTESDPPIINTDLLRFAIIDINGQLGYLVGGNLPATIGTNEVQFGRGRAFVNSLQLNSDSLNFSVTTSTTDVKGGALRARSPSYPSLRSGNASVRADGRTHKFEVKIPASEPWTTAGGLEIDVVEAGRA